MAGKYPGCSSYNYCVDNPVLFFDPNGKEIIILHERNSNDYKYVYNTLKQIGTTVIGAKILKLLDSQKSVRIFIGQQSTLTNDAGIERGYSDKKGELTSVIKVDKNLTGNEKEGSIVKRGNDASTIFHELVHSLADLVQVEDGKQPTNGTDNKEETVAQECEQEFLDESNQYGKLELPLYTPDGKSFYDEDVNQTVTDKEAEHISEPY